MEFSYVYIRYCPHYEENVCKLGRTNNIRERDSTYKTGEQKKGQFEYVFQIFQDDIKITDEQLKEELLEYHVYYEGGGTEFYNKKIIDRIELLFEKWGIKYKKLSREEIDELTPIKRNIESRKEQEDIIKK